MAHPELAAEQEYVDRAYAHLERMRNAVAGAADRVDGEVAQVAMEAWAARRLRTFEDAERGLCFGRLDVEQLRRPLYVGRRWVHDEEQQQLVVNWQAPAARAFYTATPEDPHGVTLRRRFRTDGRTLLDIADEALDGSVLDGAAVGDFLLEELERGRDAHMRDIVATIQADQYRLITHDPDSVLVIQGGPGTGKTAVGLHRASWLIFTLRERLQRRGVLVVGPNPTFMEYVSHVLPALGEDSVEQRAVGELVDGVEATRRDPPEIAELKADLRMADVVRSAVDAALVSEPVELVLRLEGSFVDVKAREVRRLVEQAREELGTGAAGRERFRMSLLRRFYENYGAVHGAGAVRSFDEVERALRAKGYLDSVLKAAWPVISPEKLVRSILAADSRLRSRGTGWSDGDIALLDEARALLDTPPRAYGHVIVDEAQDLTPMQLRMVARRAREGALTILAADSRLRSRGAGWSDGDVALLDEARALLDTPPRAYGHVIVDEAQDLTPMQLRMIARRAREGALTILGDVAQAAGAVRYTSWDEVLPHLPNGDAATVEELRHAYRVPREIMEMALPLLDTIAPTVAPPISYRTGAAPPRVVRVEEDQLVAAAFRAAAEAPDGLLAIILPEELDAPSDELVPVLTPRDAKGLEFDHVVVVEPALIDLRELYVALTRPTKTLTVVHARPLPPELRYGKT